MKCYKNIIVIICFFVFACVKVAWADSYTITFKTGSGDGTDLSGKTCYDFVLSGCDYISSFTYTRAYYASSSGLKLNSGGSQADGIITLNLLSSAQVTPTSIVVRAKYYNNDSGTTLSVNGMASQALTSSFADYTYTFDEPAGTIEFIEIKTNKNTNGNKYRAYIESITVNYTAGVSHTLSSVVDPVGGGTVSFSSTSVIEGGTATATAMPAAGYTFSHWTITGTGASLSSTSANPTTVTMGTANATVTAHFTELPAYRVTFNAGTGTCATTSLTESVGGEGVVLPEATAPAGCDPEYHFYGWATSSVSETSTPPAIVGAAGSRYYPTADVTLYAVYVLYSGNYEKVTTDLDNWAGQYLIVYEAGNKVFDGSLTTLDATSNNISVTITSNTIASNSTTDASSFIIAKTGENYTIKSSSGYYIGRDSDSNGLEANTGTAYNNSISYNDGNVNIVSYGGAYMRFNSTADQLRFRYFKSSTYTAQQAIQLYRRSGLFSSTSSCSCPAPSDLAASSITSSTAYLSWTANGTESRWQVVVSETELGDPSTETMHLVGATNYTAMSLSPLTTYYAYVRAKCDEDDFSGWIMVSFSTPCDDWGVSFAMLPTTDTLLEPAATLNLSVRGNASGRAVEWSSSNTDVATVTNTGVVTAVAEGYCVIRATVPADGTSCGKTVSCNIAVSADECARVGWGETAGVGIYTASNYSYTQQLYTAEEIRMAGGRAGKITSIKVHHRGTNSVTSKIFLGMTSKTSLKVEWETNGLQMVKNATINYIDGWTEISLTTPFEWDGESNIVVAFQNTSGTGANCYTHLLGNSGYAQSYTYNYRSHSSSSAIEYENEIPVGVVGAEFANRTNMKFCIERCSVPVDAYFSTDELSMTLSSSLNLATLLTVNPTGGVVTYTSSNTSLATVTSSGVVTASSSNEGTAVITAHVAETAGGNCSANASIRVKVCDCASGDSQYAIGAGTESSREYGPLNAYFKYSYRQIIYPADELVLGTINSIAFHYASSNEITRNIVVYMGLTNKTKFDGPTDWIPGLTEVYSGTMICSQPGWVKINLGTPFNYNDGCKNLVIAIDDNTGSYITSSCAFYYSKNSANNMQLLYDSDGTDYNPLTLTTGASAQRREYPNIKFCMAESSSSSHTLSYDVAGNCTSGTNPLSIASVTATAATVTSIVPSCPNYAGFKEWNTAADGTGKAYHAGDRISLVCENITLHAIYANEVQGESSCENAVAFCNSTNSISFAVEEGVGESYGNFCAFFNSPGTWWYMQIAEPGDLYMTIESHPEDGSRGDVDFACWGPFDNKTCNLSDLNDNGIAGWYHYTNAPGDASKHYINSSDAQEEEFSNPICTDVTLARPSGNLIDYGGSTSKIEYLQIVGAQRGDYYMLLVANYSNCNGEITFTQTGGAGRASCDIVNNCDITSISANTECTNSYSYKVSGEVSFRDAPTDGTLTVALGSNTLTFTPPFASPIAYEFTGLTPNGASMSITATFESSTVNCSKITSYVAPTKDYCKDVFLPVTLLNLRGECNGKRALISWTTASEHNNDYFVVERSDDAVNFVEVGRVAGAGNSIEMLSYNYADYSIRTGENYYRLTQVDYDGTRTTSEIIEVHCSGNVPLGDPDVYVYPNPFADELTVHLVNFGDVAANIQVYDMLGRMLFERTADDTEVVLQLGALPDAAYTVRVSTADFVVNKKVVKNN